MLLLAKKFARDVPALMGLVHRHRSRSLIAIVRTAGRALIPGDVVASHLTQRLKPPSAAFPFGTDNLGRDLLSRVILGTRGALEVALIVVALAMAIGVPLGLSPDTPAAGCRKLIMRVTDVFLSLPQLILALALGPAADAVARKRDARAGDDLLAVLHPPRLCRDATAQGLAVRRCAARHRRLAAARILFAAHPAQRDFAGYRARHDRHGLHHPGRGGAGLSRHGRHAARSPTGG